MYKRNTEMGLYAQVAGLLPASPDPHTCTYLQWAPRGPSACFDEAYLYRSP